MANIDFWSLLQKIQEYLSRNYAAALTDRDKSGQLKNYIDKYLRDNNYHVDGMETRVLIDRLYREMAEYSILTPYLGSPDLEEINVNGWDDIALTYLDGKYRLCSEFSVNAYPHGKTVHILRSSEPEAVTELPPLAARSVLDRLA